MPILTAIAKLLLVGMTSVYCTLANDEPSTFPEVLPGPGMPSLTSMGLTTTSLYTQAHALLNHAEGATGQAQYLTSILGKRLVPTLCMPDSEEPKSAEVLATFLYLHALGSAQCSVEGFNQTTVWVSSGDVYIWGKNIGRKNVVARSDCSDVAIGLGQLITGCVLTQNGVSFGGQAVAKGNSDIAIQLGRSEEPYWSPGCCQW